MPELRTLRGVELLRAGRWDAQTASGEPWEVTADVLRSAVDAYVAGVAVPVLKVGHTTGRSDAAPALGTVTNLRLSNDGAVLLGDFENVAPDLADQMPVQYPHRSVEGLLNYTDSQGRTWPLVLEAVALLGSAMPAVKELAPLPVAASRISIPSPAVSRPRIVAATARLDCRDRAVRVAAARRRRTQRTIQPGR